MKTTTKKVDIKFVIKKTIIKGNDIKIKIAIVE